MDDIRINVAEFLKNIAADTEENRLIIERFLTDLCSVTGEPSTEA